MIDNNTKKIYIETYGCQMNFSDSEIVGSIMTDHNYATTDKIELADIILINTCSIRDNAEQRVRKRITVLAKLKNKQPNLKIGIIGCMAERLKSQLLEEEKDVDIIAGPDAYRDLPQLMNSVENGQRAINVLLSAEETYGDIRPVRLDPNKISAFISIMRGCQNFCSYCVVPFTRGKERSRNPETIINEARELFELGYREVTLLGQNVNSYNWNENGQMSFPDLLQKVAEINPLLRVRFATSHPKDISDELIQTIAKHPNICNNIHLPVQSGSSRILKLMNRKYDREWYLERIATIKKHIPDCGLSTDMISGFCSETEEDHQQTLSLMEAVAYDYAFMFKYSERPDTLAAKKFRDDVPEEVKSKRLAEIIDLQRKLSHQSNKKDLGLTFEVLVEGFSKKSDEQLSGRNSQNKMVVFPKMNYKKGDYVQVKIGRCTAATLIGEAIS
ncbi:MAG: tRNA (N6-isopentenyl adenosine(37)-C2)-methylthiotransferase MiaB [Bacteroidetes bacterium HGW-Bacteroidetes-17]|jgi:tRNA-2-methylthio-N6-dimethylallyladenosine synthase|nr:MAG: tRNA (N6-isopentenyl adenosine(37)-C2)-methylthiotransferase MiaB [Bacteroidetes bacterium HGW-Bacteroidetes-17]